MPVESSPKVSVCIPSYNHARWLPMTIESILGQTYRDFEIVIADDGSTDGTLQVAQEYAARYPSVIKVFTHPNRENRGISVTANLALTQSRGVYWTGMASDDMYYPYALEILVRELERDPKLGIAYGAANVIDEEGRKVGGRWGADVSLWRHPLEGLVLNDLIPLQCSLVRLQCFHEVGFFDESLIYQDWEMAIRIMAHWTARFVNRAVTMYRRHSYNTSKTPNRKDRWRLRLDVLTTVRDKALTIGGDLSNSRILALLHLEAGYYLYCLEEKKRAAEQLSWVHTTDPTLSTDFEFLIFWLVQKAHLPGKWVVDVLVSTAPVRQLPPLPSLEKAYAMAVASVIHKNRRQVRSCLMAALKCLWTHPALLFNVFWEREPVLLEMFRGSMRGRARSLKTDAN